MQTFESLTIGQRFTFSGSPAIYRKVSEFSALLVDWMGDRRADQRTGVWSGHLVSPSAVREG